jgi:hypothetical protein
MFNGFTVKETMSVIVTFLEIILCIIFVVKNYKSEKDTAYSCISSAFIGFVLIIGLIMFYFSAKTRVNINNMIISNYPEAQILSDGSINEGYFKDNNENIYEYEYKTNVLVIRDYEHKAINIIKKE